MQLQTLQERYNSLAAEHAVCKAASPGKGTLTDVFGSTPAQTAAGDEGNLNIGGYMRRMDWNGRSLVLEQVLEGQSQLAG